MTLTTVRNQKNLGNYYTPWFPFVSTLKSQTDDKPKTWIQQGSINPPDNVAVKIE